jgi:hypothetical protein
VVTMIFGRYLTYQLGNKLKNGYTVKFG